MRRELTILSLFSAAAVITYAIVGRRYGFSDDFRSLFQAQTGHLWPRASLATGRPLLAVLVAAAFAPLSSIDDLRWLRLIGLLGMGVLAYTLHRVALHARWPRWLALAFGALACTTPPFQLIASWAITFSFPFAAALSVAAYRLVQISDERPGRRAAALAGAVGLLVASGTIYQVAITFILVPAAIDLFTTGLERAARRKLLLAGGVLVAALALCFVIYLMGRAILPHDVPPGRSLSLDLDAKLLWFVERPLPDALRLWRLVPRAAPIAFSAFLVIGMLLYFRGDSNARLAQLGLAVLLLPAAYIPNLLAAEEWSAYRTQIVLTTLVLAYGLMALQGFARLLPERIGRPTMMGVLAIGVVLAAFSARRHAFLYFVRPQRIEERILRAELRKLDLEKTVRLWVHRANWSDTFAPGLPLYDEFGLPSSTQPFALEPLIWLLARDQLHGRSIRVTSTGDIPNPPRALQPGELFLDLAYLRDKRR